MRRFLAVMARLNITRHGDSTGLAAIGRLGGGWALGRGWLCPVVERRRVAVRRGGRSRRREGGVAALGGGAHQSPAVFPTLLGGLGVGDDGCEGDGVGVLQAAPLELGFHFIGGGGVGGGAGGVPGDGGGWGGIGTVGRDGVVQVRTSPSQRGVPHLGFHSSRTQRPSGRSTGRHSQPITASSTTASSAGPGLGSERLREMRTPRRGATGSAAGCLAPTPAGAAPEIVPSRRRCVRTAPCVNPR